MRSAARQLVIANPGAADYVAAARASLAAGDHAHAVEMLAAALSLEPDHAGRLAELDAILESAEDVEALLATDDEAFFGVVAVRARWLWQQRRHGLAFALMLQVMAARPDTALGSWLPTDDRTLKRLRWPELAAYAADAVSALEPAHRAGAGAWLTTWLRRFRAVATATPHKRAMELLEVRALRRLGLGDEARRAIAAGLARGHRALLVERGYLERESGELEAACATLAEAREPGAALDHADTLLLAGHFAEAGERYRSEAASAVDEAWAARGARLADRLAAGAAPEQEVSETLAAPLSEIASRHALGHSWLPDPFGSEADLVADALRRVAFSRERHVRIRVAASLPTSAHLAFRLGVEQLRASAELVTDDEAPATDFVDPDARAALAATPFSRQAWDARLGGDGVDASLPLPRPPVGHEPHPVAWVYRCHLATAWLCRDTDVLLDRAAGDDWSAAAAFFALWGRVPPAILLAAAERQLRASSFVTHAALAALLHASSHAIVAGEGSRELVSQRASWWRQLGAELTGAPGRTAMAQ